MLAQQSRSNILLQFSVLTFLLLSTDVFAQRDLTDIPKPDPVAELAAMKVHDLSEANLFAADPDLSKPIQMNFDSTGGLWIASSEVYPQIKPGEIANDKIIVLRDTDGDGVSDKRTVFADGLLIPTGVLPDGPHAAYIAESTRLLYMQDTDHDGKADKREVVLSGFGTEDTHHLVHTLRFGPDGCVYFNQSIYIHSHIDTPDGTRHLDGGGIWRYRPETRELDVLCKGFVNPWGHVFDSVGESFVTDGAFFEGINYVFPDSVFVTSPGATRWLKGLNPGSPKHCGLEILSGTHVPPEWAGELVANDFRSHRVCRFTVKPAGSGYVSRQQPEILTTEHVAFRPIDARMGPDGALYVADWYNPIIQHGEVDFRDDRRDRTHGRIWRVSFPGRELDPWPNFVESSVEELLAFLEDPALAVRQFARQELWGRLKEDADSIHEAYRDWVAKKPASRMLEQLWIQESLRNNDISETAIVGLLDTLEPDARRAALRSVWRRRNEFSAEQQKQIESMVFSHAGDADPRVRLEAIVCAGQVDATSAPAAFAAVLNAVGHDIDHNLDFAIWQSLRSLDSAYADGSILKTLEWDGRLKELAHVVEAIGTPAAAEVALEVVEGSANEDKVMNTLIPAIAFAADKNQLGRTVQRLLAFGATNLTAKRFGPLLDRTSHDRTIPANVGKILASVMKDENAISDPDRIQTVARIAQSWRVNELEGVLADALPKTEESVREKVIAALGAFDTASAKKRLNELAKDGDVAVKIAATRSIASRRPFAALPLILRLLGNDSTGDAATDMIVSMLGNKQVQVRLSEEVAKQELSADRARSLLRRVRSAGGNAALEEAIRTAGKLENAAWKLTPELQADVLGLVQSRGSAANGEAIYRREKLQCVNCHAIGSAGGLVGPNLISVGGSSQPDYILESLLAPSAKLKEGFTTLTVLTDEAQLINGIVIGRTEDAIRMRLADGKEIQVATDSIEQEKPGKSLMPDGALDGLTKNELVDLVKFLTVLGRDANYTVSTEPVVRSYETLIYTNEANRRLNRTSTDTAASDDPAMQWRAVTAKVSGELPLDELNQFKQHRQTPPTSFVRFVVSMPADGTAKIALPTKGIEAWVDTKPTPIWDLAELQLDGGDHTIVLAVDRTKQSDSIRVLLTGDAIVGPSK